MKKVLSNLSNKLQSEMNAIFRIVTNNLDKLQLEMNTKFNNLQVTGLHKLKS